MSAMTIAILLFCVVIVTTAITVAAAALSLWVMCCGQSEKKMERADWMLRFSPVSRIEWVCQKIQKYFPCGH